MSEELLKIGQIYREHGVKGFLKAHIYSLSDENLDVGNAYLLHSETGEKKTVKLEEMTSVGRYFLLKFDCFKNPEEIAAWRKAGIFMPAKNLSRADPDDLYDFEWVGYALFSGEKKLGLVARIEYTPLRQFVLTVADQEIYVPFNKAWLVRRDDKTKSVWMDLPEGLLDL